MPDSPENQSRRFVELLTGSQRQLYAYIHTLLGGGSSVVDVLQDTNVDLWAKADEFEPGRPFLPWAYRFAYFRVMAYRKKASRCRLVFDNRFVEQLAQRYQQTDTDLDCRLDALTHCLEQLPGTHKELVQQRYVQKTQVRTIAERLGEPANRVAARLFGIRTALLKCIKAREAAEGIS